MRRVFVLLVVCAALAALFVSASRMPGSRSVTGYRTFTTYKLVLVPCNRSPKSPRDRAECAQLNEDLKAFAASRGSVPPPPLLP